MSPKSSILAGSGFTTILQAVHDFPEPGGYSAPCQALSG